MNFWIILWVVITAHQCIELHVPSKQYISIQTVYSLYVLAVHVKLLLCNIPRYGLIIISSIWNPFANPLNIQHPRGVDNFLNVGGGGGGKGGLKY